MAFIGIADTTFARFDMGALAEKTVLQESSHKVVRYTVPGIKDLPVASKKLIEEHGCEIVIACGMVGGADIDNQCAHEASAGLIQVQLMTNKHVLGVFVFQNEANDEKGLLRIFRDRTEKHALNAVKLLKGKDSLRAYAGKGLRQGADHEGSLKMEDQNDDF